MPGDRPRFSALFAELRRELGVADDLLVDSAECVYVPTFHDCVAVRIVGAELEVWSTRELDLVVLPEAIAASLRGEIRRVIADPTPLPDGAGRDGIVVAARSSGGAGELIRGTAESGPGDRLLRVAARLLDVLGESLPASSPNAEPADLRGRPALLRRVTRAEAGAWGRVAATKWPGRSAWPPRVRGSIRAPAARSGLSTRLVLSGRSGRSRRLHRA